MRHLANERLLRLFWSLVDQASYALAHFALSLILARLLTPYEYGLFSLAFAAYLFLGAVHTSLLVEPMLVFGSSRYEHNLRSYLRAVLRLHMLVGAGITLVLGVSGSVFVVAGAAQLGYLQLVFAVAVPCVLLLMLLRRMTYIQGNQFKAAACGLIYLFLVVGLIVLVQRYGDLSTVTAFALMGGASLSVAVGLWKWLGLSGTAGAAVKLTTVWDQHWQFGRWALPANLLAWVPWNAPLIMLSALSTVEAAASLRAMLNLILPVQQLSAAANTAILPFFARRASTQRLPGAINRATVLLVGTVSVYCALLIALPSQIVEVVYAGRFTEVVELLWLVALLPLFDAMTVVSSGVLRALERTREVFQAYLAGGLSVLCSGLMLIGRLGLLGAVLSTLVGFVVIAILLRIHAQRQLGDAKTGEGSE